MFSLFKALAQILLLILKQGCAGDASEEIKATHQIHFVKVSLYSSAVSEPGCYGSKTLFQLNHLPGKLIYNCQFVCTPQF